MCYSMYVTGSDDVYDVEIMHQSIQTVPISPDNSGAFPHTVHSGGRVFLPPSYPQGICPFHFFHLTLLLMTISSVNTVNVLFITSIYDINARAAE